MAAAARSTASSASTASPHTNHLLEFEPRSDFIAARTRSESSTMNMRSVIRSYVLRDLAKVSVERPYGKDCTQHLPVVIITQNDPAVARSQAAAAGAKAFVTKAQICACTSRVCSPKALKCRPLGTVARLWRR